MAYQVLARKYRPQRFADVAGQDHVTRTLTNALTQGRIAHGYIFSGHRGIGKTTIARILAMALDCRTEVGTALRPTVEPCLTCISCREIASGGSGEGQATQSFDFIEIDAASNRGIDDVRSICAQANVRPARERYKIFLLDEAHQITDAAFNAILKTLEEPPEWAIFMMATTEPESIPATIRSRCQHFSFHAVKYDDILGQLRTIAVKENIVVEDSALALLAEAGDGSMRDALSIMDQAIASAPLENGRPALQADQIRELMGAVPNSIFERLMEAVSAGQSAVLMEHLNGLITSGNSPSALARQLVRYLRNSLMAKLGGENTGLLEISADERARAYRTAQLFTEDDLMRALQILLRTYDELNEYQEHRLHLELGLLKLIQAQRLLPLEEILSSLASQPGRTSSQTGPRTTPSPSRPAPHTASSPQAQPAPKATPPAAPLSPFASSLQRAAEPFSTPPPTPFSSPVSSPFSERITEHTQERSITPPERITASATAATMASTTTTLDALALAELPEEPAEEPLSSEPEPSPAIFEEIALRSDDSTAQIQAAHIQAAAVHALNAGGHATAAVLLEDALWRIEGASVRIQVNAKPTMIRLTFNAAAEKLIRQALTQSGVPTRFLIVPNSSPIAAGAESSQSRAPLGSLQNEARNHPLVLRAQSIFNAEICSVVDLREK